jgi:nucleoprotein TPR
MMKTRRKSKAAAAAAAEQEHDQSSTQATEESNPFTIFLPSDVDLESLSTLLPDINITSPSPESVVALYKLLLAQASEIDATQRRLDEWRADVEKKDVELDQAWQDRETLSKEFVTSMESAHSELNEVKRERDQLGMLILNNVDVH